MMTTLPRIAAEFVAAVRARDQQAAGSAYRTLVDRTGVADRAELASAAAELVAFLAEVRLGDGAMVANVAGDLLRLLTTAPTTPPGPTAGPARTGEPVLAEPAALTASTVLAEPTAGPVFAASTVLAEPAAGPVLAVLAERIAGGLERAATFPAVWEKASGETQTPDPGDRERIPDVLALLPDVDAKRACEAWYSIGEWLPALLVPLQNKEIRQALPARDRLASAAGALVDTIDGAHWLLGLVLVLDDEPLIVLHRETGRGFAVTIGGIGDNFQLHTLLAAALIGRLPGTPPDPAWVAAATGGDPQPVNGIEGRFNLVDAHGQWIWNEGRPCDIPPLDGRRVVVLDPPPYPRSWNTGRVYPLMLPTLTVDAELPPAEAAGWLARLS